MEILRYKPRGYWKLDDPSYTDYSGYAKTTTLSGVEQRSVALTSNCSYSQRLEANRKLSFGHSPFVRGYVRDSFTLVTTIVPVPGPAGLNNIVEYRENLVPNPSLEIGSGGYGFNMPAGTSSTTATNGGFVGNNYQLVTVNTTGSYANIGMYAGVATKRIPVPAGKTVTFTGYVKPSVLLAFRATGEVYDDISAGSRVATTNSAVTDTPANTWGRYSVTFTVPTAQPTYYLTLPIYSNPTAQTLNAGTTIAFDAYMLEQTDTVKPYFDGSMPGYEWAGTPNNSVSRAVMGVANYNYAPNPNFDNNVSNFDNIGGGGATFTWMSTGGYDGGGFIRRGATAVGQGMGGGITTNVLPEGTYYYSFYARSSVAMSSGIFYLEGTASAGAVVTDRSDTAAVPANTWFNYRGKVVSKRPGTLKFGLNRGNSTSATDYTDYDYYVISPVGYEYFDGNTYGGTWTGTTGNSVSYMAVSPGEQQVLSSPGQMDGITVNGNTIKFTTMYANTGSTTCSYDFEYSKEMNVAAVHTSNKNSLFVDGELVAEEDVSFEQANDTYLTSPSTMVAGTTLSGQVLLMNETAIYESALRTQDIKRIYDNQNISNSFDIASFYGGELVRLDESSRVPALAWEWKDDDDWNRAMQINCITDEDTLFPEFRDGLSVSAQWLTSKVMYVGSDNITVKEMNITYTGVNATVSISFDGLNWTAVDGTTGYSFNPYKKDLYVKVDFLAGKTEAYLDNLRITAYTSNIVTTPNRTVTYTFPTSTLRAHKPAELHEDWGVRVSAGGNVLIGTGDQQPMTVEFWFKPDQDILTTSVLSGAQGTSYVNGVSSTTLKAGVWHLVHFSKATTFSSALSFVGVGTLGQVSLYPSQLSGTDIATIYASYTGNVKIPVPDTMSLAITEPASSVAIYASDYQISST